MRYIASIHTNDNIPESKAASNFQSELMQIMMDANDYLIKFRQQTNSIKLIASDEIVELLEKFDSKMDESVKLSTACLQDIQSLILQRNVLQLEFNQNEINAIGQEIVSLQKQIIKLMKTELDQI